MLQINAVSSISNIPAAIWNQWVEPGYPFICHEFLWALEQSGAVDSQTGWQPQHLLVTEQNELQAILPMYCKHHSMGEYVFDQQWARAYFQHGLNYYPKLLTAIPFTPSQGQRLLLKPGADMLGVMDCLLTYLARLSAQQQLSSWHCLFPNDAQLTSLQALGLSIRHGVQFHWVNQGYQSFADYLQTMTASKRKMLKRERRLVAEQGIVLTRMTGQELTEQHWRVFYEFYCLTYQKKAAQPYLNLAFFQQLATSMSDRLLMVLAVKADQYVAAALSFVGAESLYGRYWGCLEEYPCLHFETCYYQGIEYCIEQGLQYFDSGAQGEHKIARGFQPVTTYSAHWIADSRFAAAIADFVLQERQAVALYKADAASYLPFKKP